MIVVDDALLLAILSNQHTAGIQALAVAVSRGEVFTTGAWYWRLARALTRPGTGSLSRTFLALPEDQRHSVHAALAALPTEIGLLPMRRLVPVMAALSGRPNALTAEAVAAAIVLDARIAVTTQSEQMERVANLALVEVDLVTF